MTQQSQAAAALGIIRAVLETVKELGRAPRGAIYSTIMGRGATWEHYQQIESIVVGTGLVRADGDCLVWVGPVA